MAKKKEKNKKDKKDGIADVAWEMFTRTGIAAHYLFYKKLDK